MNISSVILRARPERLPAVRGELGRIPGVEIHADGNDGRIVVTVEDVPGHSTADALLRVHTIEGVVAASLVYQYADDEHCENLEAQQ